MDLFYIAAELVGKGRLWLQLAIMRNAPFRLPNLARGRRFHLNTLTRNGRFRIATLTVAVLVRASTDRQPAEEILPGESNPPSQANSPGQANPPRQVSSPGQPVLGQEKPLLDIVPPAVLRVPPPAYLAAGRSMTGTVETNVIDASTHLPRRARPEEIAALARLGEAGPVSIVDKQDIPVQDGRFVIKDLVAGQHVVRLFLKQGIGAELTRTALIVPPSPIERASSAPPPAKGGFAGPLLVQPGGTMLITGPFAGDGDDPELLLRGSPALLVWESSRAALFAIAEAGAGSTPTELLLRGKPATAGSVFVVLVRFHFPEQQKVSERGEDISFGAVVQGLPAPAGSSAAAPSPYRNLAVDQPILVLFFKNRAPSVVTDLWSKSRRSWKDKEDLYVPVLPEMVGADGVVSIKATAKGKSRGDFLIEAGVVVSDEMTAPRQPLSPISG